MKDHQLRLSLNDLFDLNPNLKGKIKSMGINTTHTAPWLLYGAMTTLRDNEISRRKNEREDQIREEDRQFMVQIERARAETLHYSLNELGRIISDGNHEDAKRLEEIVKSIGEANKEITVQIENTKQLPYEDNSTASKHLPTHVTYTNCSRKHSEEDRPGPSQCIYTIPQTDGLHMRCLIAYRAQNTGDKGFARLPFSIFHSKLLEEGDCPKPLSTDLDHQIPIISQLFYKKDICPLADGKEHIIEYGN